MKKKALVQAITHISLNQTNNDKLQVLDALMKAYIDLCQQYVTHFCTQMLPDKFIESIFPSPLSERWHRVAIMQAAGIAQSWRTKRDRAYTHYLRRLAWFEAQYPTNSAKEESKKQTPKWSEFNTPVLKANSIQANRNVAQLTLEEDLPLKLESARGKGFDFWLRVSTLENKQPLWLPIKLADYHRKKLANHALDSSVKLERRQDGTWWLSLSFEHVVETKVNQSDAVAIDVGINNFITSSTGRHYGSFQGDLKLRFEKDRKKRQNKAKLRACLEKKGIETLPSTSSASSERLRRHVLQSINKAVNDYFHEHSENDVILEDLSVATMRFKSKRMNAQLYASHLGHIPNQIKWTATKLGLIVTLVNPAYSSQECPKCHYVHRDNRPNQQTFCCQYCGYAGHADAVAALNLASRGNDKELRDCGTIDEVKTLLNQRHNYWQSQNAYP